MTRSHSKSRTQQQKQTPPKTDPSAFVARLFEPTAIDGLVFFRVMFGLLLFWEVARYFANGWIETVYIAPTFHFTYPGWSWVQPLPGNGMYAVFAGIGFAALGVMLGFRYRICCTILWLLLTYVFLIERAVYLNHFYLVCLLSFLMIFVPAHRSFSVDSRRSPELHSDSVPRWALRLLQAQIAIPYIYGGIAKIQPDWLHGLPMQIWMQRMEHIREFVPAFGEEWLALVFSYGGLVFDLLVVPALFWRRTRVVAFVVATLFHLTNATMFQIGIFPWLMICADTLFFPSNWPARLRERFSKGESETDQQQKPKRTQTPVAFQPSRRVVVALSIWFTVQLLVPFRHYLYSGDVNWTEEGLEFSWRMMLNDKSAAMQLTFLDPTTGRYGSLQPQAMMIQRQMDRMSQIPALLEDYCVHITRELEAEGWRDLQIRAFVLCSLNGRKPQLLVDPNANLARTSCQWGHREWIVPLTEPRQNPPWLVPPPKWPETLDLESLRKSARSQSSSR